MRIRSATSADVSGLATVHVTAWQHAYRQLVPDEFLDALTIDRRTRRWTEILAGNTSSNLVAEDGSGVVGFVSVGPSRDDGGAATTGEVMSLYVRPDRWRAGIGRQLLARAVQLLTERGYTDATLWVIAGNDRAIAFYGASGWVADGATTALDIGGRPVRELRMRRDLGPAPAR